MKKALFVYSNLSGRNNIVKHLPFIKEELSKHYELEVVETHSQDELEAMCLKASHSFDYLFFTGGDGAVNSVINYLADRAHKPILGYIPSGTTNDFARNFLLKKNIKWSVKNLIEGEEASFDICKVNDRYIAYVAACGAYSDIPYSAKQENKRRFGGMAYYHMAWQQLFRKHTVTGVLEANGKTYEVKTPFMLILNGVHMGGFYLNFENKINDGKFHIFITKPGIFNGLLHYVFFKVRTTKIMTDECYFRYTSKKELWDLDGEGADLGDIHVKCLKSHLKILAPKKVARRINAQAE